MATTNIYLNFVDETEAAFTFYQLVFGGEFIGGLARHGDVPPGGEMPGLTDEHKNLVMHVALELPGGLQLMGSDVPREFGFTVQKGNNVYISLHPDTRTETDRLFTLLSAGGAVTMPLTEMFWGSYYGSCVDRFGINWMFNCDSKI